MYKNYFKRPIDLVSSFLILTLSMPIFIPVMIALYFSNDGKPFFYQKRPGLKDRIFTIIKFKTMNDRTGADGVLLSDAERLTPVGKFVRKTSLDELPQLVNVLVGDMSLIGPRPLLPEYLEIYDATQRRRHEVRPGITGLAQVKGRNTAKFSERIKNDVYYVDNISFLLDVKILWMTVMAVFFKSDSVVHGQTVDEVDDLGLSRNLSANHFKNKANEH